MHLARLEAAKQDMRAVQTTNAGFGGNRRRCTAQINGARHAAGSVDGTEAGLFGFQCRCLRTVAVDVALDHGVPSGHQIIVQFAARAAVVEGQAARQNHQVGVVVLPEPIDDLRHQFEHAARALKALDGRPVFVKTVKHFRVDGVGAQQAVKIARFLRFTGQTGPFGSIGVGKGAADLFSVGKVPHRLEQPSPHNLKRFFGGDRLPQRLDAAKGLFQSAQRNHAALPPSLHLGLGQRRQNHGIGDKLARLGQGLDKRQIAVEGAPAQPLAVRKLPHIGDQFVDQHHTGSVARQQIGQNLFARRRARAVGVFDLLKPLFAAKLPGQLAPECMDALSSVLPRLARRIGMAVEHRNASPRDVHQGGLVEQRGNAFQVGEGAVARGKVIDRHHAVRLAAAKGGLQLNDRLAAHTVQPLHHLNQQQTHALRNKGALKKCGRLLVLARGSAQVDSRQIGGKLSLLKGAFEHIGVGYDHFTPGFHG